MAGWELTKGLQNLRTQVNERWPTRDKASDGSIGDAAHQASTSGHNPDDTSGSKAAWNEDGDTLPEVRAWDMDSDLREPGSSAQLLVDHVRKLPGVSGVLRYMIYNGKMYHSRDGFASSAYSGPSPHTEHIHFEGAWSQAADNNTSFDYKLEEVGDYMAIEEADLIVKPWQYVGGGIPAGMSTLGCLNEAVLNSRTALNILNLVLANVKSDDADKAQLLADSKLHFDQLRQDLLSANAAIANVDEEVFAKLQNPDTPDEQVAEALLSLVSSRPGVVGALRDKLA